MKRSVALLGATGSIGTSTLSVFDAHPDKFDLYSVAAHSNWKALLAIVKKYDVPNVAMWDECAAKKLSEALGRDVKTGIEAFLEFVSDPAVDVVVNALVGAVGCLPTIKAIECSKVVALANKETMVMAGTVINNLLKEYPQSKIYPIDSEHNAIFQCLADRPISEVSNIQLTASGGPFRELPQEEFENITLERALKHPTWSMGPKITIDSATLMNKGLEVLEAHFLFNIPLDQIHVVVHPQSVVHSLVQFKDGSLMAQLGAPDMKIPIQYSLSYPERWDLPVEQVSLSDLQSLQFYKPDFLKFPCLRLAFEAGEKGGTAPAILNAANEVVVASFLKENITFNDIPQINEKVLNSVEVIENPTLDDVLQADTTARETAQRLIDEL
ncbi:MAG: 1-deoxy-D-xylulose-5-phosphate reductoisomerase [Fibrobacterales bacterium]